MRKLFALAVLLVSVSAIGMAQRAATSTMQNFNVGSSTYTFDIYAGQTGSPSFNVGTSSFFVIYNSAGLSSPTLTNVNSNYTGNGTSQDYAAMTVGIVGGEIAVTISFTGNGTGSGHTLASGTPGERICTVNLNITDKSKSAGLSWDQVNSAITPTTTSTVINSYAGSNNSPLPIQIASFTATEAQSKGITISWSTVSEINNYGFEVQRSVQQSSGFTTLAGSFIKGNGTTTVHHDYSYTDLSAGAGSYYYRLHQMDLDGTSTYTEAISVSGTSGVKGQVIPKEFALQQNYPNPFNPSTIIEFDLPKDSHVKLEVYNIIGQKVLTLVDEIRTAGIQQVSFNGATLASGIYFYRLIAGDKTFMRKMTLVK